MYRLIAVHVAGWMLATVTFPAWLFGPPVHNGLWLLAVLGVSVALATLIAIVTRLAAEADELGRQEADITPTDRNQA